MNRKTILALLAGAALSFAAACDGNDNANTNTNANRATNANAVMTATPTPPPPANTNTVNWNQNREDFNKNANNYRAEAKNKGWSIGEGLEDGWIHFKVRAALAAVDDLRDSTINVDVDKNVVTLRGTVPGADQKKKAEDAAKKVEGVKSVSNKLEVSASTNSNKTAVPTANSNKK
ncbi:MAG TPA: BON domain-containing protein [Pyrinomonadaceae bacterium]|jgi:osmotically-inducible protein OsmY|nr:BON domain-containing protein [Pyrinomonadaceae bacterium]